MVSKSFHINNVTTLKENADIEEALDEAGHGRYSYFVLITCCILNIGATIDLLGYNIIVPAASCDLNLTLTQTGILTSISQAGFITAIPWGYVADTQGRKRVMLITATVGSIVSGLASFSTSFYMMLVLKFIASSFATVSITLTFVYLGENICKKYRIKYQLILNVASFGSDFICFVLAYYILPLNVTVSIPFLTFKSWRLLTIVFTIPFGVGTIMTYFFEESPKFLANKGDTDKALDILKIISYYNKGIGSIYNIKSLQKTSKTNENISLFNSVVNQIVPLFQLPLLWRTLHLFMIYAIILSTSNVFYIWFPAMLNSFFTSDSDDYDFCHKIIANITVIKVHDVCIENKSKNTLYYGMIFTFIITIANVVAVAFANWRRTLIISTCFISGMSCILVDIVHNSISSLVLFFAIQSIGLAFGSILSYYVEVFPTSYRSMATSIASMFARIVCIIGVNFTGATIVNHCRLTLYCWAAFIFCGLFMAIFLPANNKTVKGSY